MTRQTGQRLVTAVASTLLLILTVQVGAAMSGRYFPPSVALKFAPNDARLLAREAETLQKSGDLTGANLLARKALTNDPNQIIAVRTAGLLAAQRNDVSGSKRLFAYAELLTRRDLPTELWFIESNVAANDIRGALRHYDLALRTSSDAGALLFPILAHSVDEPQIANELARSLASRPPWSESFFQNLIGTDVPAVAVANFTLLALRRGVPVPRETQEGAIRNLAAAGRTDLAWQVFHQTWHGEMPLIRNDSFNRSDRPVPFEWQYFQTGDLSGDRDENEKGWALLVRAGPGVNGRVASQATILPPGRYSMATDVLSADPAMRLEWSITCAAAQKPFAIVPATPTGGVFTILADSCASVQIDLGVVHDGSADAEARVRRIAIRRTT